MRMSEEEERYTILVNASIGEEVDYEQMSFNDNEVDEWLGKELAVHENNKSFSTEEQDANEESGDITYKDEEDLYNNEDFDAKEKEFQVEFITQKSSCSSIMFEDKETSPADMFICDVCLKVFANQYKLDFHLERKHRMNNSEMAERGDNTEDKWPPNVQELARRVDGKKVFFCDKCSYNVRRCDSITKHILRVHNEGRPLPNYICEICGKVFYDRAYLSNHQVSHETEKNYRCEICGRDFNRQTSLKRHLLTHSTKRQFSCSLCDYETNRKHLMYKHLEGHKSGRTFTCKICNLQLFTQLAFRSHMYKHRPTNSCSFCKVSFSSKDRMLCHMRTNHFSIEIKTEFD